MPKNFKHMGLRFSSDSFISQIFYHHRKPDWNRPANEFPIRLRFMNLIPDSVLHIPRYLPSTYLYVNDSITRHTCSDCLHDSCNWRALFDSKQNTMLLDLTIFFLVIRTVQPSRIDPKYKADSSRSRIVNSSPDSNIVPNSVIVVYVRDLVKARCGKKRLEEAAILCTRATWNGKWPRLMITLRHSRSRQLWRRIRNEWDDQNRKEVTYFPLSSSIFNDVWL